MSKILMFSNRLIIGGPSVHLLSLVEHFYNKHEILLLYGAPLNDEASMEEEFSKFNIQMHRIDSMKRSLNPIPDVFNLLEVKRLIKDFAPDIIHTHTYKPGVIGRILAKKYGAKRIIHTYHGLIFDSYFSKILSKALAKIDSYLAKSTDVIIALSAMQKKQIISNIGSLDEEKIQIIPLSVSKEKYKYSHDVELSFRKSIGICEERLLLATVGRLADVKNISQTIEVFANLKRESKANNSVLLIVGNGDERDNLINQAESLSLKLDFEKGNDKSDIIFISWQRNLVPLYSAIDVLVLSSKNEGTPLNIIEAQMMGVTILAPNVGGIPDIVIEGETALLFDDKQAMEESLIKLVNDKKLLLELGQNASNFASKRFSNSKMMDSYNKLYNI
ncbi:MAG: glycosyltransferase [Bacteroidales bacterium]|nr:glycosyltransferase [Bacteroidales bacterium]